MNQELVEEGLRLRRHPGISVLGGLVPDVLVDGVELEAGHNVPLDRPGELAAAVVAFV